jgi:lysophospholipase L1-like esterase
MIREHISSSSSSSQAAGSSSSSSGGSRGQLFLATLPRDSFDFWALPASKVAQLQADKLHLTPPGYDLLGRVLAQQLLVLAGSSPCSGGKGRQ